MRIAIAVHGRFEAFDLARELIRRGHQVGLFTNYPPWAVQPFGVPGDAVRSFWPHGALTRSIARFGQRALRLSEPRLHTLFGTWTSASLRREQWDVISLFSGIAEETLRSPIDVPLRMVVRASAHIRTQDRLLREEEIRTATHQDRPSTWMIAREEREYALADVIRVLSSFASESFVAEGVAANRVKLIVSGVETAAFRASQQDIQDRCQRILSGGPLRVLNVGTFSFRKGVWDTAAIIRSSPMDRFEYMFVGPVAPEAATLAAELRPRATFIPRQPQAKLGTAYAWGDVFILPTIEDGFPAVLAQAAAAGLPILTTPNGAGKDLVVDGRNGWVLPIRSPSSFIERLRWIDSHRAELVDMIRATQTEPHVRDSSDVAADFEHVCACYLQAHTRVHA